MYNAQTAIGHIKHNLDGTHTVEGSSLVLKQYIEFYVGSLSAEDALFQR